jgi:glutamyl-tRNA synthetase
MNLLNNNDNMPIKTRFAPSPTGFLHFGSLRASLFPYWQAKSTNGKFVLRIDDTDQERSKPEYTNDIFNQLNWLNIHQDELYYQSKRKEIYEEIFQLLKYHNYIYECFETTEDLQYIRERKLARKLPPLFTINDRISSTNNTSSHWRFQLTEQSFQFHDEIFGDLNSSKQWSDPIIRKQNGEFTYIFASVVDDILMGITHIIRGSDHINNTFIQTNIGNIISQLLYKNNWLIKFAHFPLCNDETGKKLSKRTNSSRLEELHYLEYETLWSITLCLGTGQKPIITNNPQDYIKSFSLSNYSSCSQMFSPNLLNQINRKMLNLTFKPNNYELFQLLNANVNNRQEFYDMESKFHEFKPNKIFDELVESKNYFAIYEMCFGRKCGPRLEDLLAYINNNKIS